MILLVRRLVNALLWDEDKGPRLAALGLGAAGGLLLTGGNVPGTQVVIPGLAAAQWLGAPMLLLAWIINGLTSSVTAAEVAAPPAGK